MTKFINTRQKWSVKLDVIKTRGHMKPCAVHSCSIFCLSYHDANCSNFIMKWKEKPCFGGCVYNMIHPSKQFPVHSKQLNDKNKVCKVFKINNEDTRMMSMMSLFFTVNIFHTFCYLLTLNKQMFPGLILKRQTNL